MTQFYNAPSNFATVLGGDGSLLLEPTTLFRIMGKESCFHKIGPIMMAKKYRVHDFYDCVREDDQRKYS